MERRDFLQTSLCAAAACYARVAGAEARPPNFLFILIDDLGWADTSAYGSTFYETPNLEKLASQGMRFTDAYAAAPVCSPTRASILTGKSPARLHLTDFIPGHLRPWTKLTVPRMNLQLPLEETTIAETLKAAGYATGYFGKWHLGRDPFLPQNQGFDHVPRGAKNDNDKAVVSLTKQCLDFVEANRNRPFFAYLNHHTVHIPLQARRDLIEKYEKKPQPEGVHYHPTYAAMIEMMDDELGRIMAKLEDLGIADETVLIFYSDNGGLIQRFDGKGDIVTSNKPLRAEKGTTYEGGIRVPLIIRWPGKARPGSECSVPVSSIDLYPTMLEVAGARDADGHASDGESLVPLLRQSGGLKRDALFWHYPHYHHSTPSGVVRQGDYKLVEYYEDGKRELYNLRDDLGETTDLAQQMPDRAAQLRGRLHDWLRAVDAQMPTPNPEHDPARAHEWGKRK